MDKEDKMLKMFTEVHGPLSKTCYTEFRYDENDEPIAVSVMKHGQLCWEHTIEDLLFQYVTRDWR